MMFQYSLARNLSIKNNTGLEFIVKKHNKPIDLVPVEDYSFSLEGFNIDIKNHLADQVMVDTLEKYKKNSKKRWSLEKLFMNKDLQYVTEKDDSSFQPDILDLKEDILLNGFWQSEKYFKDIRDTLLKDFILRSPLSGKNKDIADKISDSEGISMHIRRQDYVKDPKTAARHGVLTKEYYDAALSKISTRVKNPALFIFSDDIDWVKENMKFPFPTFYISGNMQEPHIDIHLMSLCKHHIVANSSFSWWGSWLSTHPEKIVAAPKIWLASDPSDKREVVPEDWVRV